MILDENTLRTCDVKYFPGVVALLQSEGCSVEEVCIYLQISKRRLKRLTTAAEYATRFEFDSATSLLRLVMTEGSCMLSTELKIYERLSDKTLYTICKSGSEADRIAANDIFSHVREVRVCKLGDVVCTIGRRKIVYKGVDTSGKIRM